MDKTKKWGKQKGPTTNPHEVVRNGVEPFIINFECYFSNFITLLKYRWVARML